MSRGTRTRCCTVTFGLSLLLLMLVPGCFLKATAPQRPFALRPGDLLFQDLDCGGTCQAIEKTTRGIRGAHLSHIGMVSSVRGSDIKVIEALPGGVRETPLKAFLARSLDPVQRPKVLVGRVFGFSRADHQRVISRARSYLGVAYDPVFNMESRAVYCSELLYKAFKEANDSVPMFSLSPMTYKDPEKGEFFTAWQEYFDRQKAPIPEGKPGLNPASMSRSPSITIVHAYGQVSGFAGLMEDF